jgi:hypothetical protein
MVKWLLPPFIFIFFCGNLSAQINNDSVITVGKKFITLSEVVLNNKLNVPAFIDRIKNDTTFYKAFRNLHVLGYSAINDIRMLKKEGTSRATCFSKTKQIMEGNCRRMEVLEEQTTGDYFDDDHQYNYYTAQMYASCSLPPGSFAGKTILLRAPNLASMEKAGWKSIRSN